MKGVGDGADERLRHRIAEAEGNSIDPPHVVLTCPDDELFRGFTNRSVRMLIVSCPAECSAKETPDGGIALMSLTELR